MRPGGKQLPGDVLAAGQLQALLPADREGPQGEVLALAQLGVVGPGRGRFGQGHQLGQGGIGAQRPVDPVGLINRQLPGAQEQGEQGDVLQCRWGAAGQLAQVEPGQGEHGRAVGGRPALAGQGHPDAAEPGGQRVLRRPDAAELRDAGRAGPAGEVHRASLARWAGRDILGRTSCRSGAPTHTAATTPSGPSDGGLRLSSWKANSAL